MSNLRNPNIRARDIRKLVNYKSHEIIWDEGCNVTSEWVFASLEDESHRQKLIAWLSSKNICLDNEAVWVRSDWKDPKKIIWNNILLDIEGYFGKYTFEIYDLDLNWMMEYKKQEIVRFGRYEV